MNNFGPDIQQRLQQLRHLLGQPDCPLGKFWSLLSANLAETFSHTSCTILSYDNEAGTLTRLYSSRPDVHKLGGCKRVTDSFWSRKVLQNGEILIGSTSEDIKAYFSEYEVLKANGWDSILNIPVVRCGKIIGTINIMNGSGAYDEADENVALAFAEIAAPAIERGTTEMAILEGSQELEYV